MNGLLLINLGTPDQPTSGAVRKYLAEFLSDPRVLDINPVGRALLLHGVILRTRPSKSAEAYRQVWTDEGSPLLVLGKALEAAVAKSLGDQWSVKLAMRYQSPSIEHTLDQFKKEGIDKIYVFPMYPHYAASSTGSSIQAVYEAAGKRWNVPRLHVLEPFYDDPLFIKAFAAIGQPILEEKKPDHVIFSYHGLPERHMVKSDEKGDHCLASKSCCDEIVFANRNCYRAQCVATTKHLVKQLGIDAENHTIAFQSRLGRTPWIQPYTDHIISELAAKGVKKIVVFCPAFVADCLETIEEIGMRAVEQFQEEGGEELTLVPSLNASEAWVHAVSEYAKRSAGMAS